MKHRVTWILTAFVSLTPCYALAADYQCINSCRNDAGRCIEEANRCSSDCQNELDRALEEPFERVRRSNYGTATGTQQLEMMQDLVAEQGRLNRERDRCANACQSMARSCRTESQRCESSCF